MVYEGAGHGFMRAGEAPDASAPNKKARDEARKRVKEALICFSSLASTSIVTRILLLECRINPMHIIVIVEGV